MTCGKNARRLKLFAEISAIAAMFDEIFSPDIQLKLREIEASCAFAEPTISLLLPCAKDHILAQYLCQRAPQDSTAPWEFSQLKPETEFKNLAAAFCAQIQAAADKYVVEAPPPNAEQMECVFLVWKTFVLSNFIELYFFGKIGTDNTDVDDYIHAALRSIARDLLIAVRKLATPFGPLRNEWHRWVDGLEPKLILYPLTQRLWNEIPRGGENASEMPSNYYVCSDTSPAPVTS